MAATLQLTSVDPQVVWENLPPFQEALKEGHLDTSTGTRKILIRDYLIPLDEVVKLISSLYRGEPDDHRKHVPYLTAAREYARIFSEMPPPEESCCYRIFHCFNYSFERNETAILADAALTPRELGQRSLTRSLDEDNNGAEVSMA